MPFRPACASRHTGQHHQVFHKSQVPACNVSIAAPATVPAAAPKAVESITAVPVGLTLVSSAPAAPGKPPCHRATRPGVCVCGRVGRVERGGVAPTRHDGGGGCRAARESRQERLPGRERRPHTFHVCRKVVRALSGATCGRGAGTTRAPYGAEGGVHHGLPALRRLHRLPDGGSRAHAPPGGPPASMPNAQSLSRARVWTGRKVQDGLGFRV